MKPAPGHRPNVGSPDPCADALSVPERQVRCPGCGGDSLYSADNPHRPFCSARCRGADFGAWASEGFRVATTPPPGEDDPA